MAMDMVLKNLEERIEKIVKAYGEACVAEQNNKEQIQSLEAKVGELESALADGAAVAEKAGELEQQNQQLAERLEHIVASIDKALTQAEASTED